LIGQKELRKGVIFWKVGRSLPGQLFFGGTWGPQKGILNKPKGRKGIKGLLANWSFHFLSGDPLLTPGKEGYYGGRLGTGFFPRLGVNWGLPQLGRGITSLIFPHSYFFLNFQVGGNLGSSFNLVWDWKGVSEWG